MATVACVKCTNCGDTIFSRAHHDFRACTCGAVYIDGGNEYTRVGWDDKKVKFPKVFKKTLRVSKRVLYNDWNFNINTYGLIKEKTRGKRT